MPPRRSKRMRIETTRVSESRTARTREQRPKMDNGPSEPVQTNSEVTQPSRSTASSPHAICIDDIPPAVPSVHNMLDKQKVWLVGSSILKHAQLEAFLRPGGLHLNLKRLNISLWWQGYSGLKLSQVEQKLKTLAKRGGRRRQRPERAGRASSSTAAEHVAQPPVENQMVASHSPQPSTAPMMVAPSITVAGPTDAIGSFQQESTEMAQGVNKVWVIGSSIVKRASIASRERKGGLNLGIVNTEIWWQGYGGMVLSQLLPKLRVLRRIENDPDVLIIHCGANSLGLIELKSLLEKLQDTLEQIAKLFPRSKLVWSNLLPRFNWRYSEDIRAMEDSRKRVNREAILLREKKMSKLWPLVTICVEVLPPSLMVFGPPILPLWRLQFHKCP
uniref:SGNH hydrolase-type esterase domain-containing protein n=1 Tax=Magallana gigas TaxID=29159 RepID=A0A8W8I329_MAGGI